MICKSSTPSTSISLSWKQASKPDREALLARFPALREQLADCLDAVEFVQQAGMGRISSPGRLGFFPEALAKQAVW
jgi:hypothetical protein